MTIFEQVNLELLQNSDKSLTKINLGWIEDATEEDIILFTEALATNSSVYCLGLLGVSETLVCAVFESLKTNCSVKYLTIGNNTLSDESINTLAQLIKLNKTLTLIDLSTTKISDEAAKTIFNAHLSNTTLKNNALESTNIYADNVSLLNMRNEMIESFKNGPSGNFANLTNYQFNDDSADVLIRHLKDNFRITRLTINYDGISERKRLVIQNILERNNRIAERDTYAPDEIFTLAFLVRCRQNQIASSQELLQLPQELMELIYAFIFSRNLSLYEKKQTHKWRDIAVAHRTLPENDIRREEFLKIYNNTKNEILLDPIRAFLNNNIEILSMFIIVDNLLLTVAEHFEKIITEYSSNEGVKLEFKKMLNEMTDEKIVSSRESQESNSRCNLQ